MAKYAYIVAANARYLPGIIGIINSLVRVGNKYPLHLISYKLPEKFWEDVKAADLPFEIDQTEMKEDFIKEIGEADVLMRYRYLLPMNFNCEDHEAVCILDADMFICHDPTEYFDIAAGAGKIVGCGLEQKRRYQHENHKLNGEYIVDPEKLNFHDLACAPLFVPKIYYPVIAKSWEWWRKGPGFRCPDMDALNIAIMTIPNYERNVIQLTKQCWTGLHECMIKAHTRMIDFHGKVYTEDGQRIYIVHGQHWNKKWRGWQIGNQLGMIDREFNGSAQYKAKSQGSFKHMIDYYNVLIKGGPLNANDYLEDITSRVPAKDVMDIE